jgi:rRNA maturation RNase YbeY
LLKRIQVLNRQRAHKIDRKATAIFCDAALRSLDQAGYALSAVFVGVRKMRFLNRLYRRKDYATNVLSFSYGRIEIDGIPFLGEIIIAPEIAVRQAVRCGVSPERELRKLLLHGMLHLLDYDHEKDQGRMDSIQTALMRRKFFTYGPALTAFKGNP